MYLFLSIIYLLVIIKKYYLNVYTKKNKTTTDSKIVNEKITNPAAILLSKQ